MVPVRRLTLGLLDRTGALTGTVPGVASGGANLLVRLTPIAPLLLDERAVAVKGGAELDRRCFRLRVQRIRAAARRS